MKLRYRIHLPGILFILLTVFVGLAAAQRPNNLVVWSFGVLLALILVSGVVGSSMMRKLQVRRLEVRRAAAGEPLELRYVVENRSRRRSAFALQVREVDARGRPVAFPMLAAQSFGWINRVGPGASQACDAVLWPATRGVIDLRRIRITSRFPFGFNDRAMDLDHPHRIVVQPRTHPVREEMFRAVTTGGPGGFGISRRPGVGEDFYSVREFKPGDSIRQIAWKRSGISEDPLVIQRSMSCPPRLRVVVDLSREPGDLRFDAGSGVSAEDLEERAITMAASLASAAEQHGVEFGLTVLGVDVPSIPVRRGAWHRERVLTALSVIDLSHPRKPRTPPEPGDEERCSLVVVHPAGIDPDLLPDRAWHYSATRIDQVLDLESRSASRGESRSPVPVGEVLA